MHMEILFLPFFLDIVSQLLESYKITCFKQVDN